MSKFTFIIVVAIIFLCSCSKRADSSYPEFPNTKWGMTMSEVLNAYGITEKDTSYYDDNNAFSIKGYELFGEKTSEIIFDFINLKQGDSKLCSISVTYPDNADMNSVLKKMKNLYGDTVPEISIYDLFQIFEDKLNVRKYSAADHLKLWASKKSVLESIPNKGNGQYKDIWKNYQTSLSDENWDTFSQNAKMVTIVWSDNGEFPSTGKNTLNFNGYNLVVYNEIKSKLSIQQ